MKIPRHSRDLRSETKEAAASESRAQRRRSLRETIVCVAFVVISTSIILTMEYLYATSLYGLVPILGFVTFGIITLMLIPFANNNEKLLTFVVVSLVVVGIVSVAIAIESTFSTSQTGTNTYEHNLLTFQGELAAAGYRLNYTSGVSCNSAVTYQPAQFIARLNPNIRMIYASNSTAPSTDLWQFGPPTSVPQCVHTTISSQSLNSTGVTG